MESRPQTPRHTGSRIFLAVIGAWQLLGLLRALMLLRGARVSPEIGDAWAELGLSLASVAAGVCLLLAAVMVGWRPLWSRTVGLVGTVIFGVHNIVDAFFVMNWQPPADSASMQGMRIGELSGHAILLGLAVFLGAASVSFARGVQTASQSVPLPASESEEVLSR